MQHVGHIFAKKKMLLIWNSNVSGHPIFCLAPWLQQLIKFRRSCPEVPPFSASYPISTHPKLTRLESCNHESLYVITILPGLPGKGFSHSEMALRWVFYLAPSQVSKRRHPTNPSHHSPTPNRAEVKTLTMRRPFLPSQSLHIQIGAVERSLPRQRRAIAGWRAGESWHPTSLWQLSPPVTIGSRLLKLRWWSFSS